MQKINNLYQLAEAEYNALTDAERAVIALFKPTVEREARESVRFLERRDNEL